MPSRLEIAGGTTPSLTHLTGSAGSWTTRTIDAPQLALNWVKMIEVGGTRYLIGTNHTGLYMMDETGSTFREIPLPAGISGIYPYVGPRRRELLRSHRKGGYRALGAPR